MTQSALRSILPVFLGMGACGGGAAANFAEPDPQLPPSWDALITESSAAGAWQISMWTAPQPPAKGVVDVVYRILDPDGAPTDGLALQVVPWMPAHGHGTSVTTAVTPQGDGYYLVKPVYLYMSGRWEMRTTIQGSTSDSVVPVVDIP